MEGSTLSVCRHEIYVNLARNRLTLLSQYPEMFRVEAAAAGRFNFNGFTKKVNGFLAEATTRLVVRAFFWGEISIDSWFNFHQVPPVGLGGWRIWPDSTGWNNPSISAIFSWKKKGKSIFNGRGAWAEDFALLAGIFWI